MKNLQIAFVFISYGYMFIRLFDSAFTDMPINYKVFLAQFETIKKIASEGPCVIVGRCADYALEDNDNVLKLFIHADIDKRSEIVSQKYNISLEKAKDKIIRWIKRASYYNYYANKKWGDAKGYDICIDSLCWELKNNRFINRLNSKV